MSSRELMAKAETTNISGNGGVGDGSTGRTGDVHVAFLDDANARPSKKNGIVVADTNSGGGSSISAAPDKNAVPEKGGQIPSIDQKTQTIKALELSGFISQNFYEISNKKQYFTREDLDAWENRTQLNERQHLYVEHVRQHFNEIATIVPEPEDSNGWSKSRLENPPQVNKIMLDDITALNLVNDEYLKSFLKENHKNVAYEAYNECSDSLTKMFVGGVATGFLVGAVTGSPGGGALAGGVLGSFLGAGLCVGTGFWTAHDYYQQNRNYETWFPAKQNSVREIMSKPAF